MNRWFQNALRPFLMAVIVAASAPSLTAAERIILDTDMASDCDDAGALAVLHALADEGAAEILCVGVSGSDLNQASGAAVDVINTYYGRPDLPIGGYLGKEEVRRGRSAFTAALRDRWPHDTPPDPRLPRAVHVYRRALANAPDHSVTLVFVGALSNAAELLHSVPDTFSPLPGRDLIRHKVKRLVVMGGEYPDSTRRPETNFLLHIAATRKVLEEWPTETVFSGYEIGGSLITGSELKPLPQDNPVRTAFLLRPFKGGTALDKGKPSHDQAAVILAVRGPAGLFRIETRGGNRLLDEKGNNAWDPTMETGHQGYLVKTAPNRAIEKVIADLMTRQPGWTSRQTE